MIYRDKIDDDILPEQSKQETQSEREKAKVILDSGGGEGGSEKTTRGSIKRKSGD